MPYPAVEGPTTLEKVKTYRAITDELDDDLLQQIVTAVNAKVLSWPVSAVADTDPAAADWDGVALGHLVLGATMICAGLHRRKDSPDGTTAFAGAGPVWVLRNEPDAAMLLQLGPYAKPAVG